VLSVLNATVLGRDAELLDTYHARGLRQVGFVHAGHNAFADSSRPMAKNGDSDRRWGGLSPRGRQLLGALNALGIIVDVSQLSAEAQRETIALSRAPVVASHSAVRARVDAPRNLTDDELRLIAGSGGASSAGGVINVVAFSAYLRAPPPGHLADLQRLREKYQAPDDAAVAKLPEAVRNAYNAEYFALLRALPRATVADLVDAIDHVVRGRSAERHARAARAGLHADADPADLGRQLAASVARGRIQATAVAARSERIGRRVICHRRAHHAQRMLAIVEARDIDLVRLARHHLVRQEVMLQALDVDRGNIGEARRIAPDVIVLDHRDDLVVCFAAVVQFEAADHARRDDDFVVHHRPLRQHADIERIAVAARGTARELGDSGIAVRTRNEAVECRRRG
jgi:Membrane dipeptidase (Peptidase family M19)